ncbi:MAG: glycosyltransferase family 39 protein [Anaerolineales bacterium]
MSAGLVLCGQDGPAMRLFFRLSREWLRRHWPLAALVAVSLLGAALTVYGTANGPWGQSDAAAYLAAARSLARGAGLGFPDPNGQFHFLVHYPPFYSLLLALFYAPGGDLLATPRWLDVFFSAGTIFGCGYMFIRFSRSPWLALPAALLVGVFPMTVRMSHAAMSEPLFLFLLVWAGYALLAALRGGRRSLVAAALLMGLLPLTRYIGVALLAAGALGVAWLSTGGWGERLRRAALFSGLAALPILAWLTWVYLATDHETAGRTFQMGLEDVGEKLRLFASLFAKVVWEWLPYHPFYPATKSRLRLVVLLLAALLAAGLTFLARRRGRPAAAAQTAFPIFGVFGLAALTYALALLAAYLFSAPTPDVDERMLLPFYVSLMLCLLGALAVWQTAWQRKRRWMAGLVWLVTGLFLAWWLPQTLYYLQEDHAGWGVTVYAWRESPTLQALSELPAGQPVVSDNAALVLLWTGRPVYDLTATLRPDFIAGEAVYGSDLSDPAQQAFCQAGAPLVLFGDLAAWLQASHGEAGRQRLQSLLAPLPGREFSDGEIYSCRLP